MKTISKMLVALLCLTMLTGITTAPTYAEDNYIIPYNTVVNITPDLVFDVTTQNGTTMIDQITSSPEFLTYLSNKKISIEDYKMDMVSPETNTKNTIMVTNGIHKWYYMVSSWENKITPQDSPNYFTIHNNCGDTVYYIGVGLFRFVGVYPIQVHRITRWNLPAGGTLKYSPELIIHM